MEIVKRFAPFLLTFAFGLLIASFFVSVAAPNFSAFKRNGKKQYRYNHLKSENERLQKRIEFLERRNARLESDRLNIDSEFETNFDVPPPPAPPAPPAPKRVR